MSYVTVTSYYMIMSPDVYRLFSAYLTRKISNISARLRIGMMFINSGLGADGLIKEGDESSACQEPGAATEEDYFNKKNGDL